MTKSFYTMNDGQEGVKCQLTEVDLSMASTQSSDSSEIEQFLVE